MKNKSAMGIATILNLSQPNTPYARLNIVMTRAYCDRVYVVATVPTKYIVPDNIAVWFLAGAIFAILIYLLVDYIVKKRRSK